MQWQTDWRLRGRMALTMFLLFGLYVVFVGVLTAYFENLLIPVVLLGSFSLVQYFFSDKLAGLDAAGAHRPQREFVAEEVLHQRERPQQDDRYQQVLEVGRQNPTKTTYSPNRRNMVSAIRARSPQSVCHCISGCSGRTGLRCVRQWFLP